MMIYYWKRKSINIFKLKQPMQYYVVCPSPLFHLKQEINDTALSSFEQFKIRTDHAILSLENIASVIITNIKQNLI